MIFYFLFSYYFYYFYFFGVRENIGPFGLKSVNFRAAYAVVALALPADFESCVMVWAAHVEVAGSIPTGGIFSANVRMCNFIFGAVSPFCKLRNGIGRVSRGFGFDPNRRNFIANV